MQIVNKVQYIDQNTYYKINIKFFASEKVIKR